MSKRTREKHETRKLQITGGSTYILSLPKKWVTQRNLKKGSRLDLVIQNDGSISVSPEGIGRTERETEATIEVASNEDHGAVLRKMVSAYLVGFNVISLIPKDQRLDHAQRNAIKNFARKMLVGTEIIADSSKGITLKVLLSYPELTVQSALRRMCVISSSMHRDAMLALKELDKELAKEVVDMDDEVDRFNLYIVRQLKAAVDDERMIQEIGLQTRRDCLGYRLVTKAVERTADHAVEIAENILALKKPLDVQLSEKIESMSISAISLFDEAIETLFRRDFQLANSLVQKAKIAALFKNEVMKFVLKGTDIEEVSSIRIIVESITRAIEYASDIAEIVLNLNIEQILSPRS